MEFLEGIKERAIADRKTIVLAEGSELRTLKATSIILKEKIANIILLGNETEIVEKAKGLDISDAKIINPEKSDRYEEFVENLFQLRKAKGLEYTQAQELIKNPLYFGVMMVKNDLADGMVAGAVNSTPDVLRPSLQILRTAPDTKIVSSFFVMEVPDPNYGERGTFIYSDCGLNENPNSDQLSEIAISSADSFKLLVEAEPTVAMLSYSTYGSAKSAMVDKVKEATELAKNKKPEMQIDGELQVDAAIVQAVGKKKAPESKVAGKANVLIFPDLNSGNIAYKLTERLAKAKAYGPITQGIAKPVNDLSRGCNAEDIVGVTAITCVQAQNNNGGK
jgi:phosphate acetyltransferase